MIFTVRPFPEAGGFLLGKNFRQKTLSRSVHVSWTGREE